MAIASFGTAFQVIGPVPPASGVPADGSISGAIYYEVPPDLIGGNFLLVELYQLDPASGEYSKLADALENGTVWGFTFRNLPAGTYVVRFRGLWETYSGTHIGTEYWDDARYLSEATPIVLAEGENLNLGEIHQSARVVETDRFTGADRFSTAVAVSHQTYPSVPSGGVPVVYLANGLNYPDALAAGPAAIAADGLVLLTYPWELPEIVRGELERLTPQRIVVVGGSPSVSDVVVADLEGLSFDPVVDRITGSDRFATSRAIALDTYHAEGAEIAFIATGLNYPDALAAGSPAGLIGSPIILVNGLLGSVDADTLALLADLGVQDVYLIGGTPSVSAGIEADLRALLGTGHVARLAGADRFGTSVVIGEEFYADADVVFLATGLNFPDALAGAPAAAALGGPLLLSRPQCIPPAVRADIDALAANKVVLLGGQPSLSTNVEALVACQ